MPNPQPITFIPKWLKGELANEPDPCQNLKGNLMGYLSVHAGPLVICQQRDITYTKVTVPKEKFGCLNESCTKFCMACPHKFCPNCGSVNSKWFTEEKSETITRKFPSDKELYESKLNQDILCECPFLSKGVFIGNKPNDGKHKVNNEKEFMLEFDNINMAEDVAKFNNLYKEQLDILRELYESVEVKWVVANYYS